MRRGAIALALALPLAAAAQETVVTGVSTDNIALTADFRGSEMLVFGAIRRDAPIPVGQAPIEVVVTLSGPPRTVTVYRKARRLGVWMNAEGVRVRRAPSYYAVASTRPLAEILTETERLRHDIGLDFAVRRISGPEGLADPEAFAEALVRLRLAEGLYARLEGGVSLAEQTLFQARFELPTNLVEGVYYARFFLVRGRAVIASADTEITVEKAGLERQLYNLAQDRPLAYGLMSVALALAAGWLAAELFRLARR